MTSWYGFPVLVTKHISPGKIIAVSVIRKPGQPPRVSVAAVKVTK